MGAADPESTKKNLKISETLNNFIQSQNQSQWFRSLSPATNPAAPPLKSCAQGPHSQVFGTLPAMVTAPLPWAAPSNTLQPFL